MVSGVTASVNTPAASWLNNACGLLVQEYIEHGTHRMSADLRALLTHIKRRTLDFGKTSEQVSLRQIKDGLTDAAGTVIAGGLYVGESKARSILNQAISEGWVIAVACKAYSGGDAARALSLNLAKFATEIGERMEPLIARIRSTARAAMTGYDHVQQYMTTRTVQVKERLRKAVNARFYARTRIEETEENANMTHLKMPRKMRQTGGLDSEGRGFENRTPNILTNVSRNANREDAKALPLPARRSGRAAGNLQPAARSYETVEQVTRTITERSATRAAVAAQSVTPAKITIQQAQAIADQVSQEYGINPRPVFTIKAFGLLRKNAKTNDIADMRDFIRFAFSNWSDISSRHAFGLKKAITGGSTVKTTEMPRTPDAWTLATRITYFLRHYRDYLSGQYQVAERKIAREHADELQQQLEKKDRQVVALRQENQDLRDRARRASTRQQEQRGPLRPFGWTGKDDDVVSEDYDE